MTLETFYLAGVIFAFASFGVTLFSVAIWSNRPTVAKPSQDQPAIAARRPAPRPLDTAYIGG